ncbi:hypothetical protein [Rhizobium sp. BK251]|nr:hypothetical protein [Rhizobium sp. BK251]
MIWPILLVLVLIWGAPKIYGFHIEALRQDAETERDRKDGLA